MIKHAKGYSKTDVFEKILRRQILVTKSTDPDETPKAFEFSDLKKYFESTYSTDYELIWVRNLYASGTRNFPVARALVLRYGSLLLRFSITVIL